MRRWSCSAFCISGDPMDDILLRLAEDLLSRCRAAKLLLTTAESCTGGLIAATLTEIAGSSDVFERGYVTYSNAAKSYAIAVPAEVIAGPGAVSEQVARAMAEGRAEERRGGEEGVSQ